MGKVKDLVAKHVMNGAAIACATPADALIAAGVSNWGGWGLAAAVGVVSLDAHRARTSGGTLAEVGVRAAAARGLLLPTDDDEGAQLDAIAEAGAADGITGTTGRQVDGLPFEAHVKVLKEVRAVLEAHADP